jgi:CTP synthase (UTP-ammonia lyase)
MLEAAHTETCPEALVPLLVLAACPVPPPAGERRLSGRLVVKLSPDSLAYRVYHQAAIEEPFNCNYQLNPIYRNYLEGAGLKISGVGDHGEARIIEIPQRPFYIGTAFQPQLNSSVEMPHSLLVAYLKATVGQD